METVLEYFGVLSGLIYLYLEIKQHRSMWIIGFITSLIYVFVFFFAKIYADMSLNIYYTLISIYGFHKWSQTKKSIEPQIPSKEEILYSHLNTKLFIRILLILVLVFVSIYYLLIYVTDSPIPVGDAFTTAVGIVATWMLAKRIIEHWIFWIIANTVSIYIYYIRDLYPTMFLYFCYAVLAIIGLYTWKKKGIQTGDKAL